MWKDIRNEIFTVDRRRSATGKQERSQINQIKNQINANLETAKKDGAILLNSQK